MERYICKPVVVCIGTSGVVGDSLGPTVGDLLIEKFDVDAFVYGRTARPVNGLNFPLYVAHVRRHHAGSVVIAVDACLGEKKDVGRVKVSVKGLRAGAALNKNWGPFGDIGVLGVVAERSSDNLSSLVHADNNTVLSTSALVAEKVARLVRLLRLNYSSAHTI
ncbi:MAG: spore protease YyaC [Clostridia bacterium]|nr:spore protease YyaC [Clostridia bacterium]